MKTRNNKRSRAPRATTLKSALSPLDEDMKRLLLSQAQQARYATPNVLDVQFPRMKQHTYSTVCTAFAFTVTASTTATAAGGYYFSLNSLNLYTSFTQLFDRYRVLDIQLQFNSQVNAPTGGGPLITAIDYDDASTPSVEIQQRDTALSVPVNQYFERTFKPRIALGAYAGTAFTGYANVSPNQWIDSSSPNVQYYGLKYFLPIQTTAGVVYSVTARVHLQFKNNF